MAEADRQRYERLERAGIPVDAFPPAQRRVLAELSDDEIELMVRVRDRVRAAGPQTEAFGVFYY